MSSKTAYTIDSGINGGSHAITHAEIVEHKDEPNTHIIREFSKRELELTHVVRRLVSDLVDRSTYIF